VSLKAIVSESVRLVPAPMNQESMSGPVAIASQTCSGVASSSACVPPSNLWPISLAASLGRCVRMVLEVATTLPRDLEHHLAGPLVGPQAEVARGGACRQPRSRTR
jgi:hypothetical protein